MSEPWGLSPGRQYVVLVGQDRIMLLVLPTSSSSSSSSSSSGATADPVSAAEDADVEEEAAAADRKKGKSGDKGRQNLRRIVWSCPCSCIEQLFCDAIGVTLTLTLTLILTLTLTLTLAVKNLLHLFKICECYLALTLLIPSYPIILDIPSRTRS